MDVRFDRIEERFDAFHRTLIQFLAGTTLVLLAAIVTFLFTQA